MDINIHIDDHNGIGFRVWAKPNDPRTFSSMSDAVAHYMAENHPGSVTKSV